MTPSLIISCFWVIASAIVAFLPMKHQYRPGLTLLLAAPVLIVWLGYEYGWWLSLIGLFAFGSMFRNPLIYIYRRLRGKNSEVPK